MEEAGVVAEDAHDGKLQKSLEMCEKEGINFVPDLGVDWRCHGDCMRLFGLEGAILRILILYAQISEALGGRL